MVKQYFTLLLIFNVLFSAHSQSYWFGAKGGFAMNNQSWGNGFGSVGVNRDAMFSFNGDVFIESFDEEKKGALYAQLGFHTRGSALRFFSNNGNFNALSKYKFNNLVLELGAKKPFFSSDDYAPYLILGVRGEYTVANNLRTVSQFAEIVSADYVRKFNYGVTFGGGFEMVMSELSNVFVEATMQPDYSFQYEHFGISNVRNPWVPNERIDLPATQVRNLSIEIKVGVKFLRKIEYID
jgi:hypothetical protein